MTETDGHHLSDRQLILLVLLGSVLSILHSPWMAAAILPAVLAMFSRLRFSPLSWIISGVSCLAIATANWSDFEDHVFFGGYQLVAVGIALSRDDFRASITLQLRWLTGALFGTAVAWKLMSPSYRSGSMFSTILIIDERFDPITRWIGQASTDALYADRTMLQAVARGEITLNRELETATSLSTLSPLLAVWTIGIEVAIAVAFLAPDSWRLARLRHPALLIFCLTTYTLVPVAGFAVMLSAVGLSLTSGRFAYALYLLIPAVAVARGIVIVISRM